MSYDLEPSLVNDTAALVAIHPDRHGVILDEGDGIAIGVVGQNEPARPSFTG